MRKLINRALTACNLKDHLCNEVHSKLHRRVTGGAICLVGFAVTQIPAAFPLVHLAAEFTGATIHAIGLVPILEALERTKS